MSECTAKDCCQGATWFFGGIVFVALSPIIGIVGSIVCLLKAKVNDVAAASFSERTEDAYGSTIKDRNYMSRGSRFTLFDIEYLKNEQKRLNSLDERDCSLNWARGLAKCIIPIIGVVWIIFTEFNPNGSFPLECSGCMNHDNLWSPKEALKFHMQRIEKDNPRILPNH